MRPVACRSRLRRRPRRYNQTIQTSPARSMARREQQERGRPSPAVAGWPPRKRVVVRSKSRHRSTAKRRRGKTNAGLHQAGGRQWQSSRGVDREQVPWVGLWPLKRGDAAERRYSSLNRTDRMDQLLGDDGAPGHSAHTNAAGRSLGTGDHDKRPATNNGSCPSPLRDLTVYRFHHTSLVDGGKVIGAGEWIVPGASCGRSTPTAAITNQAIEHLPLSSPFELGARLSRAIRRYSSTTASRDETTVRWELRPGEIEGSLRP